MTLAADPAATPPHVSSDDLLERARALARSVYGDQAGSTGEQHVAHALGMLDILEPLQVDSVTRLATLLYAAPERLPVARIEALFGAEVAKLVDSVRQLVQMREIHRRSVDATSPAQLETLRRMTLAMAADIRVVLIRLASRLQTLRHAVHEDRAPDPALCRETLDVLAPLANRLGLWQLKWELEDLAFRFLDRPAYEEIASQIERKRHERETFVAQAEQRLREHLARAGIQADVSGRSKHIYSIYAKMQAKGLPLAAVMDLQAVRVIVADLKACYEALSIVHQLWSPVDGEYDDYIARPKPNGYRSLHSVVIPEDGMPLEVQIRTREMHHNAEYGVASHWQYKERAAPGAGGGQVAAREGDRGRIDWIRQLLAWREEVGAALGEKTAAALADERIYVLTPQGRIVDLPVGSTAVDFAYHVHSSLGHRCRGARVDGRLVPLNTSLVNGQTVEIIAAKPGSGADAPSRDWLNPDLGFVRSPRARAKVRQWFNAQELERDIAIGRERVERVLQREGRTALALVELAHRLGFDEPDEMFLAVAREEAVGPRQLEEAVRAGQGAGTASANLPEDVPPASITRPTRDRSGADGVLVVGVDLLMTQLARCCRPAPPDAIIGFVTRGKGVSVHRRQCRTFARMAQHTPERVLETAWGNTATQDRQRNYPVEVLVRASDRPGLLRDISDVFARDKLNVIAVNTLTRAHLASMAFTIEVPDVPSLSRALAAVSEVKGVLEVGRKAP